MRFSGNKTPNWLRVIVFALGMVFMVQALIKDIKLKEYSSMAVIIAMIGLWGYGLVNIIREIVYDYKQKKLYEDKDRLKGRAWDRSARNFHVYSSDLAESRFCPYCGAAAEQDFDYCNVCGKPFPEK